MRRYEDMADAEDIIRSYHRAFRTRIDAALRQLGERANGDDPPLGDALSSLAEDVIRYMEANEAALFPAVAPLVRSDEEVMAPMIFDIRAIDDTMNEAEGLALLTLGAPQDAQRDGTERIQRLVAQLEAIVRLHFEKLEHLYLPLLRELPLERRQAVLDRLAAEYGPPPEWPEAVPVAAAGGSRR
jgi:hypothetical protein